MPRFGRRSRVRLSALACGLAALTAAAPAVAQSIAALPDQTSRIRLSNRDVNHIVCVGGDIEGLAPLRDLRLGSEPRSLEAIGAGHLREAIGEDDLFRRAVLAALTEDVTRAEGQGLPPRLAIVDHRLLVGGPLRLGYDREAARTIDHPKVDRHPWARVGGDPTTGPSGHVDRVHVVLSAHEATARNSSARRLAAFCSCSFHGFVSA